MIEFFLDEHALASLLEKAQANLNEILLVVESIEGIRNSKNCTLNLSENFYELKIGTANFADLIFQEPGNERDLFRRLQICLDQSSRIPIIHHNPLFGTELLIAAGAGGIATSDDLSRFKWWDGSKMYAVRTVEEIPAAIRLVFLAKKLTASQFDMLIEEMYPNLYFLDRPDCKKMGLAYVENIEKLMDHLDWLNDHANEAYARHPKEDFAAHAAGFSVDISPESPQTHRNKAAVRERTISINGKEAFCEWHSKIEKTKGRIHFVPNNQARDAAIKQMAGEKLIIGVVAKHLT